MKKVIFSGMSDERILIYTDKISGIKESEHTTFIFTVRDRFDVNHSFDEVIDMIDSAK